ncbi:MaoC/PaaZ C-terminal domain-containing protein [Pelagerythrobacter sp.]|uniref:MaoC/PaaZ C-terminal domain-containing protein n=1 Tax=Pelagerythrobacter sp. TaxID=2800702 RepID=UPI0035B3F300
MLPYAELIDLAFPETRHRWTCRDVQLYALATGFGRDVESEFDLAFIQGESPPVSPGFASLVANLAAPDRLRRLGVDFSKVLHGGQSVELMRALPAEGEVTCRTRIVEAYDKGERGAVIVEATDLFGESGEHFAHTRSTIVARGDGGFGGSDARPPSPPVAPDRAPDHRIAFSLRPEQAALYRLLGDLNPLHVDPAAARRAGFDRPIMHGLCIMGIGIGAILRQTGDLGLLRESSVEGRFSAHCYPGDDLEILIWRQDRALFFEIRSAVTGSPVFSNGGISKSSNRS